MAGERSVEASRRCRNAAIGAAVLLAVGACVLRKQRLRRAHDELGESSAAARAAEQARRARVAEERACAVQAMLENTYQEKHGEIENWRALTEAAEAAKAAAEGREAEATGRVKAAEQRATEAEGRACASVP